MPPVVMKRKPVVASNRLVGGKMNPQPLEAYRSILQGKDVFVSLPTGNRKTFVYQLLPITSKEILCSCFFTSRKQSVSIFAWWLLARASLWSSQPCASSSLLRRISLSRFRSAYNWCVRSISPLQDLQTNQVVDGSCMPTTSLPIKTSLFPKSVYEIRDTCGCTRTRLSIFLLFLCF